MNELPSAMHPAVAKNIDAYTHIVDAWNNKPDDMSRTKCKEACRQLFLDNLHGPHVLDAGCGLGRDSIFFAANGCRVTAADIVADFLPIVRFGNPAITTVIMDMTRPCFCEEAFDGIYLFASFLHIPRELSLQTLSGVYRMLKSDGVLFMHHVKSMNGHDSYCVDDLLIPDNPAYCYCHSEDELTALLTAAGFGVPSFTYHTSGTARSPVAERYDLVAYQALARKSDRKPV